MKIFKISLVLIWCLIIFLFSSQTGNESGNTSNKVLIKIVNIFHKDISKEDQDIKVQKYSIVIRKCAHMTEYFILCILIYILLKEYKVKYYYVISLIITIIYAMSDEFHQLFVPGRAGSITDVIIDSTGALIAVLVLILINNIKKLVSNN